MAPYRSCYATFQNNTKSTLIFDSENLITGDWSQSDTGADRSGSNVPTIPPGGSAFFASESASVDGLGTEATIYYRVEPVVGNSIGYYHMHWYIGGFGGGPNTFDAAAPAGYSFSDTGDINNVDNVNLTVTFDENDSQGDAIPDSWKLYGVVLNNQFIDLPKMGAKVFRPDIFVHMDWMEDPTETPNSHAISITAIKFVVDAFNRSPYKGPDPQATGISLHVDHGPNSIKDWETGETWGALSKAKRVDPHVINLGVGGQFSYSWQLFNTYKNQPGGFKDSGRSAIFHYFISAHSLSTTLVSTINPSGFTRGAPASDSILSLGGVGGASGPTLLQMAGTFMHELGHQLGLGHGGLDSINFKPNYSSVMNYAWSTGVTRDGTSNILDYSPLKLDSLNENSLNESVGLGVKAAGFATFRWSPSANGYVGISDGNQPIDWDDDGSAGDNTAVIADINNDSNNPGLQVLNGFNDWENLKFKGGTSLVGAFDQDMQLPEVTECNEMSIEHVASLFLPPDSTPPVTTASINPAPNAAGWNNTDVSVVLNATDDISGVARTEYSINGAPGWTRYNTPIQVHAEEQTVISYRSVDRSQNIESVQEITVKIDKTSPEAIIFYDPKDHLIVVTGHDSISGVVVPGPLAPILERRGLFWTQEGSDPAEERVYKITDVADNELLLTIKVRCEPEEYEVSICSIYYNHKSKDTRTLQRNSITYRRLRGEGCKQPLLSVLEQVSLGKDNGRKSVRAVWDVLHDETRLYHWRGGGCSCDLNMECIQKCGLFGFKVTTDKGALNLLGEVGHLIS